MRHTAHRDSSHRQTAETSKQIKNATIQSIQLNWQQWLADSTPVVILPKGQVSYHPNSGFKGEAKAILSYGLQKRHTISQRNQATNNQEEQSSVLGYTSATQSYAGAYESVTDRQPATGFSFRWLSIALIAGCALLVALRILRK